LFKKNDRRSRRRNGYNLIIENEEEKNIPTLAEAKLAYKDIL
jgi:heat shock protein HspQ